LGEQAGLQTALAAACRGRIYGPGCGLSVAEHNRSGKQLKLFGYYLALVILRRNQFFKTVALTPF